MLKTYKILAVCFAAALTTTAASAATVTLAPTSPGPFEVGNSITLELATSSDFGQFAGYDGRLSFDDTVLRLDSVDISNETFGFFVNDDPDSLLGGAAAEGNEPSGEILLATFAFTAIAGGSTIVSFEDLQVSNAQLELVFGGSVDTTVMISSSEEDTAVIPLPASILLLLSCLAGLPALRFARRQG